MDTGSDANSEFVECGRNSTELGVRIGSLTDSVLLLLGIAISGVSWPVVIDPPGVVVVGGDVTTPGAGVVVVGDGVTAPGAGVVVVGDGVTAPGAGVVVVGGG